MFKQSNVTVYLSTSVDRCEGKARHSKITKMTKCISYHCLWLLSRTDSLEA